jgi:hypothetical protein
MILVADGGSGHTGPGVAGMDHRALYAIGGLSAQVVAAIGLACLGVVVIVTAVTVRRRRRTSAVQHTHARQVMHFVRLLLRAQYDYPRPSLVDLVQFSRRGGLAIRLHVAGAPQGLADAVDLAAMRIVHEALVNVFQHGTANATVVLRYRPDRLVITVDNPLKARPIPVHGRHRGVEAMRHRAGRVGGTVTAGPHEGGWRVRADLPLGAQAAFA